MGMSVKLVSAMLGHSKVETTQNLYQHIDPSVAHRETNALAQRMLGRARNSPSAMSRSSALNAGRSLPA
jgi:site-specific recombinase XerD